MILKQDGSEKNDCEHNASKRFYERYRREHPHLKTIIISDALGSNAPNIKEIKKNNCRFIIGAKPKGNKFLFNYMKKIIEEDPGKITEFEFEEIITLNPAGRLMKKPKKRTHKFKFINNVPLNESNQDVKVNFLDYQQYDEGKEKPKHFSWVTDIEISKENVYELMKGGRARWKIENETFNTLTNQGYNAKHNYGLGKKHLSTNFIYLMMLAFLVDQVQQLCCPLFKSALEKSIRKRYFWERIRGIFLTFPLNSFETIYKIIIKPPGIILDFSD